MTGELYINSDIFVDGKIKLETVPNNIGTVLTYNETTSEISFRSNSEIIDDLNLVTVDEAFNTVPIPFYGSTNDANTITKSGFYGVGGTLNTGGYISSQDGLRALLHFETENVYSASQIQTERYTGNILSRTRQDGLWTGWIRHWGNNDFTQTDVYNWKNLVNISGNYVTLDTPQNITGRKEFTSNGGYGINNNSLWISTNNTSYDPSITFNHGDNVRGQIKYSGIAGFRFTGEDGLAGVATLQAGGYHKAGRTDGYVLLAGGGDKPLSEFLDPSAIVGFATEYWVNTYFIPKTHPVYNVTLSQINSWNDIVTNGATQTWVDTNFLKIDKVGQLNNVSDTHTNRAWFDYNWAGTGLLGSVINFSGLYDQYPTEIFVNYNDGKTLSFRSKNGDTGIWNDPYKVWHTGNFDPNNYVVVGGNYVTLNTIQEITATKYFTKTDTTNNGFWDKQIVLSAENGLKATIGFYSAGMGSGIMEYDGYYNFKWSDNSFTNVKAFGFVKDGSTNDMLLLGAGHHMPVSDFVNTYGQQTNILGKKHFVDGIQIAPSSRINLTSFDTAHYVGHFSDDTDGFGVSTGFSIKKYDDVNFNIFTALANGNTWTSGDSSGNTLTSRSGTIIGRYLNHPQFGSIINATDALYIGNSTKNIYFETGGLLAHSRPQGSFIIYDEYNLPIENVKPKRLGHSNYNHYAFIPLAKSQYNTPFEEDNVVVLGEFYMTRYAGTPTLESTGIGNNFESVEINFKNGLWVGDTNINDYHCSIFTLLASGSGTIKLARATVNGINYIGLKLSPTMDRNVFFKGYASNVSLMQVYDYFNANDNTVVNGDINSSIVEIPFNSGNGTAYFNNKRLWNDSDFSQSNIDNWNNLVSQSGNFLPYTGATQNVDLNGKNLSAVNLVSGNRFNWNGSTSTPAGKVSTESAFYNLGSNYGYGISTNINGGLDIMSNQGSQPIRLWAGGDNINPYFVARFEKNLINFYSPLDVSGLISTGSNGNSAEWHEGYLKRVTDVNYFSDSTGNWVRLIKGDSTVIERRNLGIGIIDTRNQGNGLDSDGSATYFPNSQKSVLDNKLTPIFHLDGFDGGDWKSSIILKGWSNGYRAWRLTSDSSTGDYETDFYYSVSKGSDGTWLPFRKVWTDRHFTQTNIDNWNNTFNNVGNYWEKHINGPYKGINTPDPLPIFKNGNEAQGILTGGILTSNLYSDQYKVPNNGAYFKGLVVANKGLSIPFNYSSGLNVPNIRKNPLVTNISGTGAMVIKLPELLTNAIDKFKISLHFFGELSQTIYINNSYSNISYSKFSVENKTQANDAVVKVRLGTTPDGKSCIILNDTDFLWNYVQVIVDEYVGGSLVSTIEDWSAIITQDLSTYTDIFSVFQDKSNKFLKKVSKVINYGSIAPISIPLDDNEIGVVSFNNDGSYIFGDYIHFGGNDISGGNGNRNLLMLNRFNGNMRKYLGTPTQTTPYTQYVDYWHTDHFTQTNINNWNTAFNNQGNFVDLTTEQNITGTKIFRDDSGNNNLFDNVPLRILGSNGTRASITFYSAPDAISAIQWGYDNVYHFSNSSNLSSYNQIKTSGFIKYGSSINHVLLGDGSDKALGDFILSSHIVNGITQTNLDYWNNKINGLENARSIGFSYGNVNDAPYVVYNDGTTQVYVNLATQSWVNSLNFANINHTHSSLLGGGHNLTDVHTILEDAKFKFGYQFNLGAPNLFPTSNNANSVIAVSTHPGGYGTLIGFNGDSDMFIKNVVAGTHSPTWNQIATQTWTNNLLTNNYVKKTGDTMTGTLYLNNINSHTLMGGQIMAAGVGELYLSNGSVTTYLQSNGNLYHNTPNGAYIIWDGSNFNPDNKVSAGNSTYGLEWDGVQTYLRRNANLEGYLFHSGNFNPSQYVLQSSLNTQLNGYATLAGTQTFDGTNTFSQSPIVPSPSLNSHVTNKDYVDNKLKDRVTAYKQLPWLPNLNVENKWSFYKVQGGTGVGTPRSYRRFDENNIIFQSIVSEGTDLVIGDNGSNYTGLLRSVLYTQTDKTITFTFTHDDGCAIYINGIEVYSSVAYSSGVTATFDIKVGYSVMDFIWDEGGGGDGVFSITPTIGSQVDKIYLPQIVDNNSNNFVTIDTPQNITGHKTFTNNITIQGDNVNSGKTKIFIKNGASADQSWVLSHGLDGWNESNFYLGTYINGTFNWKFQVHSDGTLWTQNHGNSSQWKATYDWTQNTGVTKNTDQDINGLKTIDRVQTVGSGFGVTATKENHGLILKMGQGPSVSDNRGTSIGFWDAGSGGVMSGIYVKNNGQNGTQMAFTTTDSYATGPQIGMSLNQHGIVDFPRNLPTFQGASLATQNWVTSQGYLTNANLSGYATQSWVNTNAVHSINNSEGDTMTDFNSLTNQTMVGSALNSNGTWYHLINIRHRNGAVDGGLWGSQIRIGMNGDTDKFQFRTQFNGTWSPEWKTVWHSDNFNPTTKADITYVDDKFAQKWENAVSIGFSNGSLPTNNGTQYPYIYHNSGIYVRIATQEFVSSNYANISHNHKGLYSDFVGVVNVNDLMVDGQMRFDTVVSPSSTNMLPNAVDNANSILSISSHPGYGVQLGFNTYGEIHTRYKSNGSWSTTWDTLATKKWVNDNFVTTNSTNVWFKNNVNGFIGINATTPFSVLNNGSAQQVLSGGLLTSNNYNDYTLIPSLGIFSRGDVKTSGTFIGNTLTSELLSGGQVINVNSSQVYFGNPQVGQVYFESGNSELYHNRGSLGIGNVWTSHNLNPNNYITVDSNPQTKQGLLTLNSGFVSNTDSQIKGRLILNLTVIDLTALDPNTFYPVTLSLPTNRYVKIKVGRTLDGGYGVPPYSTHSGGFTLMFEIDVLGAGWGTTDGQAYLKEYKNFWINGGIETVGFTQMTNSSNAVVFLRGGSKYDFESDTTNLPVLRTSVFEMYGQVVQPTTNRVWEGFTDTRVSNFVTKNGDEFITGQKHFHTIGPSYTNMSLEAYSNNGSSPGISFHKAGNYAGSIQLVANDLFSFRNISGTILANIQVNNGEFNTFNAEGGNVYGDLNVGGIIHSQGVVHDSYNDYDYVLTSNGDVRPVSDFQGSGTSIRFELVNSGSFIPPDEKDMHWNLVNESNMKLYLNNLSSDSYGMVITLTHRNSGCTTEIWKNGSYYSVFSGTKQHRFLYTPIGWQWTDGNNDTTWI